MFLFLVFFFYETKMSKNYSPNSATNGPTPTKILQRWHAKLIKKKKCKQFSSETKIFIEKASERRIEAEKKKRES